MKNRIFFFCLILLSGINRLYSQTMPIVVNNTSYGGSTISLDIRDSYSFGSVITTLQVNKRLVASSVNTGSTVTGSNGQSTNRWYVVDLPNTANFGMYGAPLSDYVAAGSTFTNPECSAQYIKVISPIRVFIRPNHSASGNVTIGGAPAYVYYWQQFALSNTSSSIYWDGSMIWYLIDLPNNCSQTSGWVAGSSGSTTLATLGTTATDDLPTPSSLTAIPTSSSSGVINWNMEYYPANTTFYFYNSGSFLTTDANIDHDLSYALTSLTPCSSNNITMRALFGSCLSAVSSSVSLSTTCCPTAPTAFSASGVTSNSFTANWSGVSGLHYYIDVSTNSSFTSTVYANLDAGIGASSFSVTGLSCNTTYYYRVKASNGSCTGSPSSPVNVTTAALSSPGALSASGITPSSFNALWAGFGGLSYYIDVSPNSAFTDLIYTDYFVGVGASSFYVTGLPCSTPYFYRVRARNGSCTSSPSSTIPVTTGCCPIYPPGSSTVSSITFNSFAVSWSAASSATGYYIDVSTDPGFSTFVSGYNDLYVGSTLFQNVTGLSCNTIYYYRIRTANGGCMSTSTSPMSVTTNAPPTVPSDPSSVTVTAPAGAGFSVSATGASLSYQWQVSTNSGVSWSAVSSGSPYSGESTSSLSISATTASMNGYLYRCRADNSCGSAFSGYATLTVNPDCSSLPAIMGAGTVCAGAATPFTYAVSGGTWSSSNASIATIGSASGTVTGISAGTVTITYALPTGCTITKDITVNIAPSAIMGLAPICAGETATLSNSVSGGTWSSNNTTIATIGSANGMVSGITAGTANITYALSTGCAAVAEATINALPTTITGNTAVCQGLTSALSNGISGGTWSSDITAVATVGSGTGVVTGIAAGTANITYALPTGCRVTTNITVNSSPAAITGTVNVCVGLTTALTNATSGGTWSSDAAGTAVVGSASGIVTGIAAGTANITYALPSSCMAITGFTVNSLPSTITGTTNVCPGLTTTLNNATTGGTWSSDLAGVATIGSASGIVTGVAAGTANITYTLPTGCATTVEVSVGTIPSSIDGTAGICTGLTTALSNAAPGGTWSSGNPDIAEINSSGVATGISAGTAIITYNTGCGAPAIRTVSVYPLPGGITGLTSICTGASTPLSSGTAGGSWTSGDPSVITIGTTSGLLTGIAPGTTTITYTLSSGCISTLIATVNSLPDPITGNATVCAGSITPLTSSPSGGTWSSSAGAVATVGSTGIVSGISAGTSVITYSRGETCLSVRIVTVNALPAVITGVSAICAGSASTLGDAATGGAWTSGTPAVATIGSTGLVTGIAAGTTTISYTLSATGCLRTKVITVTLLTANSGSPSACVGSTTPLSNTSTGGTWSSSDATIATVVTGTGVVTGIMPGTAIISYKYTVGCTSYATTVVTINTVTTPTVTGTPVVCAGGGTTTLTGDPAGGTWSSSAVAKATVGSTGMVTGAGSTGTVTISYTYVNELGCAGLRKTTVTVNSLPTVAAIGGVTGLCVNAVTTLTDATSGGAWTSASTDIATLGTAGMVTGIAAGIATISYTVTGANGCMKTNTKTITINALPSVSAIDAGTGVICAATTRTLTDTASTGTHTWVSATPSVATINSSTGVVTGVTAGTTVISYNYTFVCTNRATTILTINAVTTPTVTGSPTVCASGGTTELTGEPSGGTWSTSSASRVSIAPTGATVVVTGGTSSGTATVSYTYTNENGCAGQTIKAMTVNALPSVANIGRISVLCVNATGALTDATTGGTWSSGNADIATVGTTGLVTGVSAGSVALSYTVTGANGCNGIRTRNVTVNALPSVPDIDAGGGEVCPGSTLALSNAATGTHSWTSSTPSVATVNASTGLVTGIAAGTTVISYNYTLVCLNRATTIITVNPPAAVAGITGESMVSVADSIALFDSSPSGSWTSGNPSIATIEGGTGIVTGVSPGTVNITYTIMGCGTARAVYTVTVTASKPVGHEQGGNTVFSVYPNPTTGKFTVTSPADGVFSIYSMEAKEVMRTDIKEGINLFALPKGLATGVYMCRFKGVDGSIFSVRLVYAP